VSALKGKDYVATRNLWTREGLVAAVGERCDMVPVDSLEALLASGKIVPVPKADKKAKA
jgi:hypothetical protein